MQTLEVWPLLRLLHQVRICTMTKIERLNEHTKTKFSGKEKPVSIVCQIIAMFVPFGWIWASHRIGELRQGVLIFFIIPAVISAIIQMMIPIPNADIVLIVIFTAIQIYFIHKWSTEWNSKFS